MHIYRLLLIVTLLLTVPLGGLAQQDSVKKAKDSKSIKLSEVTVRAKNVRIEDGKIILTPTKQSKNLANDIASLIDLMDTGILEVVNGEIKTNAGQNVAIFVNGQKIDEIEKSTFWAKNVSKVEYMPMPNDSQFLGETHVLNIIMRQYATGGVTKLDARQNIPNNGNYSVASKLVANKITFNALIKGGYSTNNFSGVSGEESYNDVWYGGTKYDNILRTEKTSYRRHNKDISAALNARCTSDKFSMLHGLNLNWRKSPENTDLGKINYSPGIIDANRMEKSFSSKNHTTNFYGLYHYKFSTNTTTQLKWEISNGNNKSHSLYSETDAPIINTNIKEDNWECKFSFFLYKNFSDKLASIISLNENLNFYNTSYSGYTLSNQKQNNSRTELKANIHYTPNKRLILSFRPLLSIYSRNVNDSHHKKELSPAFEFQGYYEINSKSFTNFGTQYYFIPPQVSMTNNLILRQTELKWIQGNPELKNKGFYYFYAGYNLIPTDWCTFTAHGSYTFNPAEPCLEYRSGDKDFDGVIGKYINGNNNNRLYLKGSVLFKPIKSKIHLKGAIYYSKVSYTRSQSLNSVDASFNIKYFLPNFVIYGEFFTPRKTLQDGGNLLKKTDCSYLFGLTYGNGNINLNLTLNNIFNKRRYEHLSFINKSYSYHTQNYERGQRISLSLTYTFDYGKKVSRKIDIDAAAENQTSILGAN